MRLIDYYSCLGLTRSATNTDIKKAYRRLALKYHPKRNVDPEETDKFYQIAEAYDVLINDKLRAIYDQFGEEGLRRGVPLISDDDGTNFTQPYIFHGDAEKVFKEFFGGINPFSDYFTGIISDPTTGLGGLGGKHRAKKQEPSIEQELQLTLEECFYGCTKKMKISRRVLNEDGETTIVKEKILTIPVQRGCKVGTRFTFSQEGDQGPNIIPADLIFITVEKPHPRFRREGPDLIYTENVELSEALAGYTVELQTIDDRKLRIPINDIIKPEYVKIVPGEGMPLSHSNFSEKGNLRIEFNVGFPKRLTAQQKLAVKKDLQ